MAPSQLNNSITRMYQSSLATTVVPTGADHGPDDASKIGMCVDEPGVPLSPAVPAQQQPAAHSQVEACAPSATQGQANTANDVNAPQPEQERNPEGKAGKKRSKALDAKARSLKRIRDSSGEAGPAAKRASIVTPKRIFYSDLGGIDDVLADIRQLIEYPLMHPEVRKPPVQVQ